MRRAALSRRRAARSQLCSCAARISSAASARREEASALHVRPARRGRERAGAHFFVIVVRWRRALLVVSYCPGADSCSLACGVLRG
jgi:hypothetical protein